MKRIFIIAFIHIAILKLSFGQNQIVIPPPPTASALGKYVDNPISLYTGTPDISIPLYELKVKDFTLPIGLSYHAGGIKVEEGASNVGLGWVLNAGGMITRSVREIPDDAFLTLQNGQCPGGDCSEGILWHGKNIHDIDLSNTDPNYIRNDLLVRFYSFNIGTLDPNYQKVRDSEPDIFYFNFAGNTGKFIFNVVNGYPEIKLLPPYQNIIITHTTDVDHRINQFTIIDESGIKYTFGAVERLVQLQNFVSTQSVQVAMGFWGYATGSRNTVTNMSWYLTKIETPLGQIIDLSYADEKFSSSIIPIEQTSFQLNVDYNTYNPNVNGTFTLMNGSQITDAGKRLFQISSDNVLITFQSDHARQDMYGDDANRLPRAITGMIVFNKIGSQTVVKKVQMEYDYFTSSGGTDQYYKRLRLRKLRESTSSNEYTAPPYEFEYKYSDFTSNSAHVLPWKKSFQQDLWGYYNAATGNNTLIPALYVYPFIASSSYDSRRFSIYPKTGVGTQYILSGANRIPNAAVMDVGLLTKIKYPTGGYTQYEYEPHTFRDDNQNFSGGGIRVKKITKYDGVNALNNIEYNYSYEQSLGVSSGRIISIPVFAVCDYAGVAPDHSEYAYKVSTTRFNISQSVLGNTQGSNIGYKTVTETLLGNGKTVYTYSIPASWYQSNDNNPGGCSLSIEGTCDNLYSVTQVSDLFDNLGSGYNSSSNYQLQMNPPRPNTFPFPENPEYDWNRGHILSEQYFNQAGIKIKEKIYTYKIFFTQGHTVPTKVYGFKIGRYYPKHVNGSWNQDYTGIFRAAKYEYLTDVSKVKGSVTETLFDVDDPTKSVSTMEEYVYGSNKHSSLTEYKITNSNQSKTVTKYKYPNDYTYGSPLENDGPYALGIKYIRNIPIEIAHFNEKDSIQTLIGGELNTYKLINNLPILYKQYKIDIASPVSNFAHSFCLMNSPYFVKDSRFILKTTFEKYDNKGNVLQINDSKTGLSSYIWGYNQSLPVSEVRNADVSQVAYNGFEMGTSPGAAGWESLNSSFNTIITRFPDPALVYAGNNALVLAKATVGATNFGPAISNITPEPQKGKYKISCWINTPVGYAIGSAFIGMYAIKTNVCCTSFPAIPSNVSTLYIGPTNGTWKYFESVFDFDAIKAFAPNDQLSLRCFFANTDSNYPIYIDEIRIHPLDAMMTTYTYKPLVGVTTILDENNTIENRYDYDVSNRLRLIRDKNDNIVQRFSYKYKGTYLITFEGFQGVPVANAISPDNSSLEIAPGGASEWTIRGSFSMKINGSIRTFPYTSANGTLWQLTNIGSALWLLKASNISGPESFSVIY